MAVGFFSNFVLIINSAVQWRSSLGVYAAVTLTLDTTVFFASAIILIIFGSILLLMGLGVLFYRWAPGLCGCLCGGRKSLTRDFLRMLTVTSIFITLTGTFLRVIKTISLSDQYADEANSFATIFTNSTSAQGFFDDIGRYFSQPRSGFRLRAGLLVRHCLMLRRAHVSVWLGSKRRGGIKKDSMPIVSD